MRYIIIFKYGKYKLSKLHIIFKESNESDFYIYIYINSISLTVFIKI